MKRIYVLTIAIFCFLIFSTETGEALKYDVVLDESEIESNVRYTVVGTYKAVFKDFSGNIDFDPKYLSNSSVELNVKTKSLESKYSALDRAARSKHLLNVRKYPFMKFKSKKIFKRDGDFFVTGTFTLNGVEKEMTFPFSIEGPITDYSIGDYIRAQGKWQIDRKEFGIIWNQALDKGGIVVGDTVTIDWKVFALYQDLAQ